MIVCVCTYTRKRSAARILLLPNQNTLIVIVKLHMDVEFSGIWSTSSQSQDYLQQSGSLAAQMQLDALMYKMKFSFTQKGVNMDLIDTKVVLRNARMQVGQSKMSW